MNTQQLKQVFQASDEFVQRLSDNTLQKLWETCGERPRFWCWFLHSDCVEQLRKYARHHQPEHHAGWKWRPEADNRPGHLVVPVVPKLAPNDSQRWNLAASSFGLPIVWRAQGHDPRVPSSLRTLADEIKRRLLKSAILESRLADRDPSGWGIGWPADWQDVDLSDLQVEADSAWAPLAVGFVSLLREQPLESQLFASGYWKDSEGRWDLGQSALLDKLDSAIRWGRTRFAVPRNSVSLVENELRARNVSGEVVFLRDIPDDLALAVEPALALAEVEPGAGPESRDAMKRYYRYRPSTGAAREYYVDKLLPQIVASQREAPWYSAQRQVFETRPRRLVTIVSNSPELVQLAILLFRPKTCSLVYTNGADDRMRKNYEAIEQWAKHRNSLPGATEVRIEQCQVDDTAQALPKLAEVVATLPGRRDPGDVLIDMTPGRRPMSMALLEGSRPGDRVLCWWTDTDEQTRRIEPFSEFPLLWEVTADRALRPLVQIGHAVPGGWP